MHLQDAFENVKISDESGQQLMPASKAFCLIIKYLKKQILEQIDDRKIYIKPKQILWVFPLPSTWCEEEQEFFSNCVIQVKNNLQSIYTKQVECTLFNAYFKGYEKVHGF